MYIEVIGRLMGFAPRSVSGWALSGSGNCSLPFRVR